jgi:hypothetical protein
MLIYNVTVKVENEIAEDWLNWMRQTHIVAVLRTGCFSQARLTLMQHEEEDGKTYAIQYSVPSQAALDKYMSDFAPELQREHRERYDGRFVAFRSVLELIDEFNVKFT